MIFLNINEYSHSLINSFTLSKKAFPLPFTVNEEKTPNTESSVVYICC